MHPSSVADWLAQHRPEAGLTVRMSAAGLITFAVAHLFGLTQIYWAVLTAVFVTQASIAGNADFYFVNELTSGITRK